MHMVIMLLASMSASSMLTAVGSSFEIQTSIQKRRWQQPKPPPPSHQQLVVVVVSSTSLHAKASKSKRNGGQGKHSRLGGGERSNDKNDMKALEQASFPKASQTRPVVFSFDLSSSRPSPSLRPSQVLQVTAVQINDPEWWNENNNAQVNPYGARLWPSSFAIAKFIALYLSSSLPSSSNMNNNNNNTSLSQEELPLSAPLFVLELGCGVGLVSLVVATAAQSGATVLATDISPMALSLTRQGWMATTKKKNKRNNKNEKQDDNDTKNGAEKEVKQESSFSTSIFDIMSTKPLPLPAVVVAAPAEEESRKIFLNTTQNHPTTNTTQQQLIVIAGAMLYDAILAKALARRVVEAVHDFGAWVIVGDDDSGQGQGGRAIFLEEMDRQKLLPILRIQQGVVQHAGLGWSEKHVKLLHFNAPSDPIIQIEGQST